MNESNLQEQWNATCDAVSDHMKIFTRPFVAILASSAGKPTGIGTGTFFDNGPIKILTCEHVSRLDPSAIFLGELQSSDLNLGVWCIEPDVRCDVAFTPVAPDKWRQLHGSAQTLPLSSFATHHAPVENELLFFRGIAGENAYVGATGTDAIITGYCSQEKKYTGDKNIFEICWNPDEATVTTGTPKEVSDRFSYSNPSGFSGSLVWNTRFVELGCDFNRWSPNDARVTGLLRRFDENTSTLLAWRVEHLIAWINSAVVRPVAK